jgi:hypothetical protein
MTALDEAIDIGFAQKVDIHSSSRLSTIDTNSQPAEESVGKIKNREKRGYKYHSTQSKNSVQGNCGPKVFCKSR